LSTPQNFHSPFPLTPALSLRERPPRKFAGIAPLNLARRKLLIIKGGVLRFMGRENRSQCVRKTGALAVSRNWNTSSRSSSGGEGAGERRPFDRLFPARNLGNWSVLLAHKRGNTFSRQHRIGPLSPTLSPSGGEREKLPQRLCAGSVSVKSMAVHPGCVLQGDGESRSARRQNRGFGCFRSNCARTALAVLPLVFAAGQGSGQVGPMRTGDSVIHYESSDCLTNPVARQAVHAAVVGA